MDFAYMYEVLLAVNAFGFVVGVIGLIGSWMMS